MDAPRILIVDDDDLVVQLMAVNLELCGFSADGVRYAASLDAAVDAAVAEQPGIIFLDNRIPPHRDFRPIYMALRQSGYKGPVVVQSACIAADVFDEAPGLGISAVLDKLQVNDQTVGLVLAQHLGTMH